MNLLTCEDEDKPQIDLDHAYGACTMFYLLSIISMYSTTVTHTPRAQLSREDYESKLSQSATLYVGNLSFYTSEEQIYELFSLCGEVKRVIMGLDRQHKTPCGFCFVEYPLVTQ